MAQKEYVILGPVLVCRMDNANPNPTFERPYQAARGFFELGMWQDAWDELDEIPPELRQSLT